MRFCPKCGTRLPSKAHPTTVCEKCGYGETSSKFGYRPWQPKIIQKAVQSIKAGRKVILDAPTGSGKTLVALKVAEVLLGDHSFEHAFVAVRTINEMVPYERD
ncbi:MAG: DEAD/DEAH box helicase family protein, partial [Nitrososphaerales archaeon]